VAVRDQEGHEPRGSAKSGTPVELWPGVDPPTIGFNELRQQLRSQATIPGCKGDAELSQSYALQKPEPMTQLTASSLKRSSQPMKVIREKGRALKFSCSTTKDLRTICV